MLFSDAVKTCVAAFIGKHRVAARNHLHHKQADITACVAALGSPVCIAQALAGFSGFVPYPQLTFTLESYRTSSLRPGSGVTVSIGA